MKKYILLALIALSFGVNAQVKITQLHIFKYPASPIIKDSDLCIINKHDSVGSANTVDSATGTIFMKDLKAYNNANTNFADTAIQTTQYVVPTTGNTIQSNNTRVLIENPAGTLAALTIDFPASPVNREVFRIIITQIITTLTLTTASPGTTINGTIVTSSTNSCGSWIYLSSVTTWFKLSN